VVPEGVEEVGRHFTRLSRHPHCTPSPQHTRSCRFSFPRPMSLRGLKGSLARFGALKVLHEGAETDDGDDALAAASRDCTRRHTSSKMAGRTTLTLGRERDERLIGRWKQCRDLAELSET